MLVWSRSRCQPHRKRESQRHVETRIKVAENEVNLYPQDMDATLKSVEETLLIRRQIGTLEKRFASLLGTAL